MVNYPVYHALITSSSSHVCTGSKTDDLAHFIHSSATSAIYFWQQYVTWGPISISEYGLINGLFIFSRFVMIVFLSTVLTLTTKPIDLTDGINKLLSPLRLVKIPVDDISIMLSISLRFIPNLLDETQKVMDAQRARGTEFGDGSLFKQMKTLVPIFLPLFASSLNRAEDMANMMDVKGYNSGIKRSTFRRVYWKKQDTWCLCGVFFIGVVTVLLRG